MKFLRFFAKSPLPPRPREPESFPSIGVVRAWAFTDYCDEKNGIPLQQTRVAVAARTHPEYAAAHTRVVWENEVNSEVVGYLEFLRFYSLPVQERRPPWIR